MSPTTAAGFAIFVVGFIIAGALFWAWFTAGSPPSSLPTEDGSASYPPPSSSSSEGSISFSAGPPASISAEEEEASNCTPPQEAALPLNEVRYGSYLEDEGITTRADLQDLSSLSEVPHVGTAYGQIIATDLAQAGVPEIVIPPVVAGEVKRRQSSSSA